MGTAEHPLHGTEDRMQERKLEKADPLYLFVLDSIHARGHVKISFYVFGSKCVVHPPMPAHLRSPGSLTMW